MKKILQYTIVFGLALLISQVFAATAVVNNTLKSFSGAGCMGCHQSQTVLPETKAKTAKNETGKQS